MSLNLKGLKSVKFNFMRSPCQNVSVVRYYLRITYFPRAAVVIRYRFSRNVLHLPVPTFLQDEITKGFKNYDIYSGSCKQTQGRKEDARVRSEKSDERRGLEWENGFCFINISNFLWA